MMKRLTNILSDILITVIAGVLVFNIKDHYFPSDVNGDDHDRNLNLVNAVNEKIIDGLGQSLFDGYPLTAQEVREYIDATARNCGVSPEHVIGIEQLPSHLVKQVVDSPFFKPEEKMEMLNAIQKSFTYEDVQPKGKEKVGDIRKDRYRSDINRSVISVIIGNAQEKA